MQRSLYSYSLGNNTLAFLIEYKGDEEFLRTSEGIYFDNNIFDFGNELWFSDGSKSGTNLLSDLMPSFDSSNVSELSYCRK